jgi:hypothetical protein
MLIGQALAPGMDAKEPGCEQTRVLVDGPMVLVDGQGQLIFSCSSTVVLRQEHQVAPLPLMLSQD